MYIRTYVRQNNSSNQSLMIFQLALAQTQIQVDIDAKDAPTGNRTQGTNNDLSKSVNHFLKGDGRAAMASFGSVMRRTKEKAAVAMVQAKEKIKTRMSSSGAGDGSYPGDESGIEKGPMDLAFLFAEPECLETPDAPPEIVPEREVAPRDAPRSNKAAAGSSARPVGTGSPPCGSPSAAPTGCSAALHFYL